MTEIMEIENKAVAQKAFDSLTLAKQISLQGFMNCFLRETGAGALRPLQQIEGLNHELLPNNNESAIHITLEPFSVQVLLPIKHHSLTGHHRLDFPVLCRTEESSWHEVDLMMLASLCLKHMESLQSVGEGQGDHNFDVLTRLTNSYKNMAENFEKRYEGFSESLRRPMKYLQSEQSLLIGHQMHPLPKSREGFDEEESKLYSPEHGHGFQLRYLSAAPTLVLSDSALELSAKEIVIKELRNSKKVPFSILNELDQNPDSVLIPMHPWQMQYIKTLPKLKDAFAKGLLKDLGEAGPEFFATSSVRTVASEQSQYQYKFSMNITITNSKRLNLYKELKRGVEFTKVWQSHGQNIQSHYSSIETLNDPAYLTLQMDGEPVNEVSVILRQNLFNQARLNEWRNNQYGSDVTALAALCQDDPFSNENRLSHILKNISQKTGLSYELAAKKWFAKFLEVAVAPMLYLYKEYGLAFEAHQQNTLIRLKDGYPETFFYRDNQGTGYIEEWCQKVRETHPEVGQDSQCLVPLEFVDHHFTYYFFVNNVLGVINGLGCTQLVDERVLLQQLKAFLIQQKGEYKGPFNLLDIWLTSKTLACKGNLLTRMAGLDELLAPLESQSVYFEMENPLLEV